MTGSLLTPAWRRLQVSRRVRDSLTQTQRCAADKRFLARFEKEREVGFAMLRVGAHCFDRGEPRRTFRDAALSSLPHSHHAEALKSHACRVLPCPKFPQSRGAVQRVAIAGTTCITEHAPQWCAIQWLLCISGVKCG